MPSHVIVVEKRNDFRWNQSSGSVITAEEYLAVSSPSPRRRIVNLCRDHGYLSAGYYVSLLAEARGDRVVPGIRAFTDLDRRNFQSEHACVLQRFLPVVGSAPAPGDRLGVPVYFGQTDDPQFGELARQAFERLGSPLLRIDLERNSAWRIAAVRAIGPGDIPATDDALFLRSLAAFVQRGWRRPATVAPSRFDLAVLVDRADPLPPSKPKTLERLAVVGQEMGVNVTTIERKDYARLTQFDALFIRETSAVPHHTFRFARKAEREGMPVIDDPASIVRCTNKVFLAELLRGHGVPTPNTRFLTRGTVDRIDAERKFPVVIKIPDGSFSIGVERATSRRHLRAIAEQMLSRSEIVLLQDYVPTTFDWRIGLLAGKVIFAARYYMCGRHWQILKHAADGSHTEGRTEAVPIDEVPPAVLETAIRAGRAVGDGLYGVDLKETGDGVVVMEVNDNPNIDVGMEDAVLGDELYRRILRHFLVMADQKRRRLPADPCRSIDRASSPRRTIAMLPSVDGRERHLDAAGAIRLAV